MSRSKNHLLSPSPPPDFPGAPLSTPPQVRCAHTRLVPPWTLKPQPVNPNQHPEPQLILYDKILRAQGWRKSITVSLESGCIVTGHGAWKTAMQKGWPLVPIDEQHFPTPEDEKAHVLADNRLPQLSQVDDADLRAMLSELDDLDFDLDLTGFDESDLPTASMKGPRLVELDVKPLPPKAWALISAPVADFGAVQRLLDQLPKSCLIKTCISNGRDKEKE